MSSAKQDLTVQANGTESTIYATNGQQNVNFLKQMIGDSTEDPPWATWLTPLSYSNPQTQYSWPSSTWAIPAGKTYKFGVESSIHTGYQDWYNGSTSEFASRSRYWRTFISTYEANYD